MSQPQSILQIQGTVTRAGSPLESAYIDLLDGSGTFIAERRTGPDGEFSFHTTPGSWTLVCRVAGAEPVRREVAAEPGSARVDFELGA